MINKLQKRNTDGFTIIEVVIVLAIAALILLIVLLAVPALQRNSRNTSIKSDVGAIAGGVNTFESNNNGLVPNSILGTGRITIARMGTGCATWATPAPREIIDIGGGTAVTCPTGTRPTAQVPAGTVQAFPGRDCPATLAATGQPDDSTASARAVALYYSLETSGTSGGITNQCTGA